MFLILGNVNKSANILNDLNLLKLKWFDLVKKCWRRGGGLLKRLLKIALGNFLVKMFIFILLCRVWNSGNMEMIGMRKIVPQYVVNELNKLNLEWEWWRTFLLNISFAWKCKILGVLNFCSVFKSRNVLKQWRGVTC